MKYRRIMILGISVLLTLFPICHSITKAETALIDQNEIGAFLLMEGSSGQVIEELNGDADLHVAGLTRLAALLVICEAIDRGELKTEDNVMISEFAAAVPGPTAFLETNESVSVEDLLKCAVMINAGDAIVALAEKLHGTEEVFLKIMNARMKELGIDKEDGSLSATEETYSAKELAIIGKHLVTSECFTKFSSLYIDELLHEDGRKTELVTPNKMVKDYSGCYGIATGSSKEAGYCGVFAVKRAEQHLILVLLGAKNSRDRFQQAMKLFDHGSANYRSVILAKAGETIAMSIPVNKGTISSVDLIAPNDLSLILEKSIAEPVEIKTIPESLDAPFAAGDIVGKVDYTDNNGRIYATLDLITSTGAELAGYGDYFRKVLFDWIRQ